MTLRLYFEVPAVSIDVGCYERRAEALRDRSSINNVDAPAQRRSRREVRKANERRVTSK